MLKKLHLFNLLTLAFFSFNAMGNDSEICLTKCIFQYEKCLRPISVTFSPDQNSKITSEEKKHLMSYLKASSIDFIRKENKMFVIAKFSDSDLEPKEISIIQVCQDERMKCKVKCEK